VDQLPPSALVGDLPVRDLVVSPGFIGVALLVAAVIAASAVLYRSRRARQRSERQQQQLRDDAAKALTWERWQWIVDTAGIEPAASEGATLGLGPAVTLELVGGLLRDAERLGDETLARAIAVYQEQLVLVLAQQAGPLSSVTAPDTADAALRSSEKPATEHEEPAAATTDALVGSGGRRRRA
jgi:cell division protein FtsL